MENKKRYVATTSFYIYADSDEEVVAQLEAMRKEQVSNLGNQFSIDEISEIPFGVFKSRKLDVNKITITNNIF